MKKSQLTYLIVTAILVLNSCKKENSLIKNENTNTEAINITGTIFKGSFVRGSLLNFYELDSNLNQTGKSFNATINDDYGNFSLNAIGLKGKIVRVIGDGFYWNEVLNKNSKSRITLTGICKIDSNEVVNVNVLTQLEKPRVEYLYTKEGYSFAAAKSKAVQEVLAAFGFVNTSITRSEKVNIIGNGEDSKILLAISVLIQGFRTESEVTELLSNISQDLEKDGALSDTTIGNDLATHLYYIDTTDVLKNVKDKFSSLYNVDTVNSLNLNYLNIFQTNTTFKKNRDLIEYPSIYYAQHIDLFGVPAKNLNILSPTYNGLYDDINLSNSLTEQAILTREGMKLKIEIKVDSLSRVELENLGSLAFFTNPYETTGWVDISGVNEFWTLKIIAEKLGTYERLHTPSLQGANSVKLRIYFYERDFSTPTRFKDLLVY
jgi:hypothetical protein